MVTSLASFRSDYTIVHIPSGNFLDVRQQLYSNINLLRMGCGGRAALTLEEPRSVVLILYRPPYIGNRGLVLTLFAVMRLRTVSLTCIT